MQLREPTRATKPMIIVMFAILGPRKNKFEEPKRATKTHNYCFSNLDGQQAQKKLIITMMFAMWRANKSKHTYNYCVLQLKPK